MIQLFIHLLQSIVKNIINIEIDHACSKPAYDNFSCSYSKTLSAL